MLRRLLSHSLLGKALVDESVLDHIGACAKQYKATPADDPHCAFTPKGWLLCIRGAASARGCAATSSVMTGTAFEPAS